jgi:hypothetical protein
LAPAAHPAHLPRAALPMRSAARSEPSHEGGEMELSSEYLDSVRSTFGKYRELSEGAMAQVDDEAFRWAPDAESNSIAQIVKHMGGNLRSRWTAFLETDGEKPDRNRDAEFEEESADSREALMRRWEEGWNALDGTLDSLSAADLLRTVTIRGEPHSVVLAIERALTHAAYHAGQIVYLAKHLAGGGWQTLSIPRAPRREATPAA